MHVLHPHLTTWHITFGTYGARLHGDRRATVDKTTNERGEPFVGTNEARLNSVSGRMRFPPVRLTYEQRRFIESIMPEIADRGGWVLRTCAAGPDHVHVLLDVDRNVHGEKVRRLIKRWLGQAMSARWELPEGAAWWVEEGSNKAVRESAYLNRVFPYVHDQRATRV